MSGGSLLHPWNQAAGTPRWRFGRWVSFFEIMSTCYLRGEITDSRWAFEEVSRWGWIGQVGTSYKTMDTYNDDTCMWWYHIIYEIYIVFTIIISLYFVAVWQYDYVVHTYFTWNPTDPCSEWNCLSKVMTPLKFPWDGSLHWWILETFNFETHTYMFTISLYDIYIYIDTYICTFAYCTNSLDS